MIAHSERTVVTTLTRAPWAAGVVFSLAMHGALAAIIVGQDAQAPAVGGAMVVDVVLVDGPDATPAADPAAPKPTTAAPKTLDIETSEPPAPDAPALVVEAPIAQDVVQDEPTVSDAAEAAAEKLSEIASPAAAPPTTEKIPPGPRPVDLAGPEKSISKDAARATANAAAQKTPDAYAKARSVSNNTPPKSNAAAGDKIGNNRPSTQTQKAALPSGASRGASPLAGNPKPAYPRLARRRNQEGRVLLRVLIMPDGGSGAVTVVESSGHGVLDRAAVAAVSNWRFRPATRAGVAVTSVLEVPVRFRLRSE